MSTLRKQLLVFLTVLMLLSLSINAAFAAAPLGQEGELEQEVEGELEAAEDELEQEVEGELEAAEGEAEQEAAAEGAAEAADEGAEEAAADEGAEGAAADEGAEGAAADEAPRHLPVSGGEVPSSSQNPTLFVALGALLLVLGVGLHYYRFGRQVR